MVGYRGSGGMAAMATAAQGAIVIRRLRHRGLLTPCDFSNKARCLLAEEKEEKGVTQMAAVTCVINALQHLNHQTTQTQALKG
eukprot:COSAG06_NODE_26762_length_607_cov_35.346457_1_plen_82_part_10